MALKKAKKIVKKGLRTFAKIEAAKLRAGSKIVNTFVPGLGKVSNLVADQYDKLSATNKSRFHKAKGKTAKLKILKK